MKFERLPIAGAFLVQLEPHVDPRGSFSRAFCAREFAEQGIEFQIVQANIARTRQAGVVRGLHYQLPPAGENKLVRCLRGSVFDSLVDMRTESSSYRAVYSRVLSAESGDALFIPAGVAHGYQSMDDGCEFFYMTDQFYRQQLETGVRYDDPLFGIRWPLSPRDVTDRDRNWPLQAP